MGLRRKGETRIWPICVPLELAVEAELLFAGRGAKPIYGIKSQVVCTLLERWVKEMKEQAAASAAAASAETPAT